MANAAQPPKPDSKELPPAYAVLIVVLIAVIGGIAWFGHRSSRFQTLREAVSTRVRRRTLSKEEIKRIPIIKYHGEATAGERRKVPAIRLTTHRSREQPQASLLPGCSICSEDVHEGVKVRKLPCGHLFHRRCIDKWLMDHASTCPLCRVDLEAQLAVETIEPPLKAKLLAVGHRLMR